MLGLVGIVGNGGREVPVLVEALSVLVTVSTPLHVCVCGVVPVLGLVGIVGNGGKVVPVLDVEAVSVLELVVLVTVSTPLQVCVCGVL